MHIEDVIRKFEEKENAFNVEGMRRFGIVCSGKMYGVNIPVIRTLAKEIKTDHKMALELWCMNVHEAKILATMISDVNKLTEELMEEWVVDLYSWDICDQLIMNYFEYYPDAIKKALDWSERDEEFVKRAGFVLMARMAMRKFGYSNEEYQIFYEKIKMAATDDRNFVKKAVNWAIRQIGKRNIELNKEMTDLSSDLLQINDKNANWIARNAIKELKSEKVQEMLKLKNSF